MKKFLACGFRIKLSGKAGKRRLHGERGGGVPSPPHSRAGETTRGNRMCVCECVCACVCVAIHGVRRRLTVRSVARAATVTLLFKLSATELWTSAPSASASNTAVFRTQRMVKDNFCTGREAKAKEHAHRHHRVSCLAMRTIRRSVHIDMTNAAVDLRMNSRTCAKVQRQR
jgi:hypothetical protein